MGATRLNLNLSARKHSPMLYASLFVLLSIGQLAITNGPISLVEAKDKGGDDIILAKGRIIMRGGKGKGNIILDPGHSEESHHEMPPMMSMMGHFNPYAFYPMSQHHQPQVVIRPIYIEDHSAMHQQQHQQHQPEEHQEQHHEEQQQHHEYHHEEPQHHHYEPQHQEMEQQQHHQYEPMQHEMHQHQQQQYESNESHEQPQLESSAEEQQHMQQHHQAYGGHPMHPIMSLMSMHGSGPQPIYHQQHVQQMAAMQALQQPAMYAQQGMTPDQHAAAYQRARYLAAEQEAAMRQQQQQQHQVQQQSPQELQQGQSSEMASHSPGDSSTSASSSSSTPSKPASKVTALLEKAANNPLGQIIKPLFKRNKEQNKDSSLKKP